MPDNAIIEKAKSYIENEENEIFRREIEELLEAENMDELRDRFYTDLEFGTGGLRGVIGGGSNRMNAYNVRRSTQGLANYILKSAQTASPSVVIAFDNRHFSDVFAMEAAMVLCGNGIKTFLFSSLRPTPQLSFTVRLLRATAGIVVTASHNPAEYNGYKVYWTDGGQIVPPHDNGIVTEARAVKEVKAVDAETARQRKLLEFLGSDADDEFIKMVKRRIVRPALLKEKGKDVRVVYTPLHGAGSVPVSRALTELGVEVAFVEEQKEPDGDFPTAKYPNPEEPEAMSMALELGKQVGADLVLGTDPDADRLGIAVPEEDGFRLVSGNQLGALLADYIFSGQAETGTLPEKPAFVKTIVTTELQRRIAENYGAQCFDTLTGFKYIGEKIREFESAAEGPTYVFGGEESYGYLAGTEVRDKDAVGSAVLTVEMALYHRGHGRTVLDALNSIYQKYGYFEEILLSRYFKGEKGFHIMNSLMEELRAETPKQLGGQVITMVKDYREGIVVEPVGNRKTKLQGFPSSNVLQFILESGDIVTARPSGTEPKIKFYASCGGSPNEDLESSRKKVHARISAISDELKTLVDR